MLIFYHGSLSSTLFSICTIQMRLAPIFSVFSHPFQSPRFPAFITIFNVLRKAPSSWKIEVEAVTTTQKERKETIWRPREKLSWQICSIISRTTLFEICIFCPKIQLWFPENVSIIFWVKNSWKCCGLDFLAVDNFNFTRKIVKKKVGWKTRENVGVLSKLNFWTKIWLLW